MTITICLLTRNHASSLSPALKSVAAVADELLVADTGSTDGTNTVAREHNARVIDVPFRDDFASALNSALDAATGTWVLQLNPDEELDPASIATVRAAVAVPTA